jgi:trimethylamine--corrinoid protein Co-methyltransferase
MNLEVLSREQIDRLHEGALRVLAEVGTIIEHEEARHRLADAGCTIADQRVKMPAEVVERALAQITGPFRLYASRGDYEIEVGWDSLLTMTLGGAPDIYDLQSGRRRPATSDDLAKAALVADWAEHIHIFAPLFGQENVPGKLVEMMEYVVTVRHFRKPFNAAIYSPAGVHYITEMAAVVAGGIDAFRARPTVVYSICPISPLRYTQELVEAIIAVAEYGVPLSLVPLPVLGVSSPITLAGALIQQNAEILAGLVLAYQYRPGLPVMYNGLLCPADMRTALSIWGPPEVGLAGACSAQLARRYNLPCKVYGFSTSSKTLDMQNGVERSQNALMAALAGPSMLGGIGGGFDLLSASLEQLVIDNEIVDRILFYRKQPVVDQTTIALAGMREVTDGVPFLGQVHTVEHLRAGVLWQPFLSDISSIDKWEAEGAKAMPQRATELVQQILEEHQVEPLPQEVDAELDRLLSQAEAELLG